MSAMFDLGEMSRGTEGDEASVFVRVSIEFPL